MMMQRRSLLRGLLAAPAIIRTPGLLMAIAAPRDGVALHSMSHPHDFEPYTVTAWGINEHGKLVCEELEIRPQPWFRVGYTSFREIHGIELSSDSPDRRWGISHD